MKKIQSIQYILALAIITFMGCKPDVADKIDIGGIPTAAFDVTPTSNPNRFTLTNKSTGTFLYKWDLGDGTTADSTTVIVAAQNAGNLPPKPVHCGLDPMPHLAQLGGVMAQRMSQHALVNSTMSTYSAAMARSNMTGRVTFGQMKKVGQSFPQDLVCQSVVNPSHLYPQHTRLGAILAHVLSR